MRFRLRTLMIVLALGPMACAVAYWTYKVAAEQADMNNRHIDGLLKDEIENPQPDSN